MIDQKFILEHCIIPDATVFKCLQEFKIKLQAMDQNYFLGWQVQTISEIVPSVHRSFLQDYSTCTKGLKAYRVAGIYAFWFARLQPCFTNITTFNTVNECLAILIATSYLNERLSLNYNLVKLK